MLHQVHSSPPPPPSLQPPNPPPPTHTHTHNAVKAHHEMMKRHSYENVQLQALAEKKKKAAAETAMSTNKLQDVQRKNCADDGQHTYVNAREHHTYVNVKTSANTVPVDHTYNTDWGVAIPPPPPPMVPQKRDSGSSPSPHGQVTTPTPTSPTPNLPPRTNGREAEKGRSPTPPIPERHYSDADIRMTPPPPLPQRQYCGSDDTLSPPPLPDRKYTATDLGELKSAAGTVAQAQRQGQGETQNGPHHGGNLEGRDRSKSLDSDHSIDSRMKYEISELGHQYALVTKGKVVDSGSEKRGKNAPPPLPKRFRERFHEDSPFPITGSTENISQAGTGAGVRNSNGYVDIDPSSGSSTVSSKAPYTDTIAYAVVKVDRHSNSPPSDNRRPIRRVNTPRPYEDAVSSGSGTPPPPALSDSTKPKRPPAYEDIDNDSSDQMDGKMATIILQISIC